MRARNTGVLIAIVALAFHASLPGRLSAQAQSIQGGSAVFRATVPSIVKLVVEQQAQGPAFRVVTNDPMIRARMAGGLRPELMRRGQEVDAPVRHAQGDGAPEAADAGPRVVRFTVVAP